MLIVCNYSGENQLRDICLLNLGLRNHQTAPALNLQAQCQDTEPLARKTKEGPLISKLKKHDHATEAIKYEACIKDIEG